MQPNEQVRCQMLALFMKTDLGKKNALQHDGNHEKEEAIQPTPEVVPSRQD